MWFHVVWCGIVWCGVVWSGVAWCSVPVKFVAQGVIKTILGGSGLVRVISRVLYGTPYNC